MALAILDGTQTATTLSTILSSGQHITAHTVVSLGAQAITDILNATSAGITNTQLRASAVTIGGTVTVGNSLTISSLPAISGTVTANLGVLGGYPGAVQLINYDEDLAEWYGVAVPNAGSPYIPARIVGGSVTIGNTVTIAGTVTANPTGTQTITGSVTASISGTVPISISSVTVGNSVTIASLPAISGVVTAKMQGKFQGNYLDVAVTDQGYLAVAVDNQISISDLPNIAGTVTANTFAVQGTAVTTSNFTSTTASTVLANYNATRQVLTIFNEGAGNLHLCAGATCTTIAYQVRLSAGDYYEVPNHQTTITHSAVFATAGTARICQLS